MLARRGVNGVPGRSAGVGVGCDDNDIIVMSPGNALFSSSRLAQNDAAGADPAGLGSERRCWDGSLTAIDVAHPLREGPHRGQLRHHAVRRCRRRLTCVSCGIAADAGHAHSGVAVVFRWELEDGDVPRLFGDGRQRRDFGHVDAVVAANAAAISADRDGFTTVNVRSGRTTSTPEMVTEVCEACGDVRPLVTGQYRSGDVHLIVADPARVADLLGLRPVVDPRDGLQESAYAPLRD
jgi:hypothetical protein